MPDMEPQEGDIRVDAGRMYDLGVRALMAVGVMEEHAHMTSHVLITSDLRGIESHGFARFAEYYVYRSRDGYINLEPNIRVVQDAQAAATIDGDGALGFVPSTIGMQLAIEKARATGVGMVSIRNGTHYGPSSPYAMMALEHDMVGIAMTTGGVSVVPPGGAARTYGPNVICVAAPSRPPLPPFVLDMATSVVAVGKLEIAQRRGRQIPEGWAADYEGNAVTDPFAYPEGRAGILPLGSDLQHGAWKGFGLSVMVDIFTGMLSGGHSSSELPRRAANHFCGALRIDAFTSLESFYDQMDSMRETMRNAPRQPDAPPLTFAGEPEAVLEADYRANGIPYPPPVIEGLKKMCADIGIVYDLE